MSNMNESCHIWMSHVTEMRYVIRIRSRKLWTSDNAGDAMFHLVAVAVCCSCSAHRTCVVAVCFSVMQCVVDEVHTGCGLLQWVAVCCSMLQCVAVAVHAGCALL